MPAASYNFEIEQGTTFRRTITYYGGPEGTTRIPILDAHLQARKTKQSDEVLLELSVGNGFTIVDGSIDVLIPDTQTGDLMFKRAFYDLKLTLDSADKDRVIEGIITVDSEVTRG